MNKQQSNILSAAVVITASSLVSAVLGLLRNRLLVGAFFDTPFHRMQLDAYWVAFRLPELLFQLLVIGTVSATLIPVFNKYMKKGQDQAYIVANSVLNLVLLIYVVISVFIFVFAPQLTQLITSENFNPAQIILASQLTRIILFAQLFFAASNFLSGIIQAQQRFLIPALSPAAYNFGIILGIIFLTPVMGIYGAAVGVVIGSILHLLLQLPLAIKLGFSYRPIIALRHPGVQDMIRMSPPRILNLGIDQLELLMSVFFATALPLGSLTIINLAQQMVTAPTRIFSVPLGQASLPFLSKQVAADNMKQFCSTVQDSLQHIFFLAFPAGMLLLILRIPLVRIAYGASEFPWAATLLTGKAVAIMSIALFAQGGIHLLARAFYALQNTVIPLVVSTIAVLVNVGLSFMAVYVWHTGVLGISTALTVSTILHFSILLTILLVELKDWTFLEVFWPSAKIFFASAMMAVFLWVPMRFLDRYVFDTTRVVPLLFLTGTATVIGGAVFLSLAKWMKIPEYNAYMMMFRKIGNWKQVMKQSEEAIEPPTQSSEMTS